MTLEISSNGISSLNPLVRYPDRLSGVREMEAIYKEHFINYASTTDRYVPLDEDGSMLIICYGPFLDAMQPFIEWKRKKGMQTEIVNVSDIAIRLSPPIYPLFRTFFLRLRDGFLRLHP